MRIQRLIQVILLLLAVATAAWLSVRWQWRADFSYGQRASLAQASVDVLHALDGATEVTSFARPDGPLRATIGAFVARYRQHKPDLSMRFIDPDVDPGAMRERGISLDGEIEITHGGRSQRVSALNEREFTLALTRLARGGERILAYVVGHGERKPDGEANFDLGRFATSLASDGIRSVTIDLSSTSRIPANTDLLVIGGPRVPLAPGEVNTLRDWIDGGGALLWLTDPASDDGLAALALALGVSVLPGTVVDAAGQGLGIGDPGFVAMSSYPAHATTREFALTTLYPQASALGVRGDSGFAAAPLLRSSARSWTENGPVAGDIRFDAEAGEIPGPLDLALALTRLSPRPDRNQQRIVVIGDGDFVSNSFIGNGGNRALAARIVNWLLGDDALVDIAPNAAPDRSLALTKRQAGSVAVGFLIVLPLLLLLSGALIAWRRRRG